MQALCALGSGLHHHVLLRPLSVRMPTENAALLHMQCTLSHLCGLDFSLPRRTAQQSSGIASRNLSVRLSRWRLFAQTWQPLQSLCEAAPSARIFR